MRDSSSVNLRLRRTVERLELPADCLGALVLVWVADLAVLSVPAGGVAVRTLAGLGLLFVLPGYAVQAALFPRGTGAADAWPATGRVESGLRERLALSFGLSLAVVPLVGVGLDVVGVGFGRTPFVAALTGLTVVGIVLAVVRRNRLPPDERFRFRSNGWLSRASRGVRGVGPSTRVVNVVLALAVVFGVASTGVAVTAPADGEAYTSFALLTETPDGDLVAGGYPAELTAGESTPLVVGIENHEKHRTSYTVVVQLQRVGETGSTVRERRELDRFTTTLAAGETRRERRAVTPATAGTDLRLAYLLYRGEPPRTPTRENAYRGLHVWVDVNGSA